MDSVKNMIAAKAQTGTSPALPLLHKVVTFQTPEAVSQNSLKSKKQVLIAALETKRSVSTIQAHS